MATTQLTVRPILARQRGRGRHRAAPARPGRLMWGLVDQGLVSLAGAVLTVQGARLLTPAEFGRLAAALAAYYVLLSVNRGVIGEVFVLRHAGLNAHGPAAAVTRRALRASLELAGGISVLLVIASVIVSTPGGPLLAALAVALPALLVQDVCRAVLVASGRTARSAASSAVVVVSQLLGGVALHATVSATDAGLMVVWAAAGILGVLSTGLLRRGPTTGGAASWLQQERSWWPRFGLEALAQAGASQLGLLAVAAVAGAGTVGGLRAATVLLSPLLVLQQSAGQLAVAELVRTDPVRRWPTVVVGQVLMLAVSAGWVALLAAVPDSWLGLLVGPSLPGAVDALPGMAIFIAAGATVAPPLAALRLSGGARAATRLRLSTAVFPVTVPALVALAGGGGSLISAAFGAAAVGSAVAWTAVAFRYRTVST